MVSLCVLFVIGCDEVVVDVDESVEDVTDADTCLGIDEAIRPKLKVMLSSSSDTKLMVDSLRPP